MLSLVWLLALALIFPAVWGWLVHLVSLRLWPAERRRKAPWPSSTEPKAAAEFLDYQI